MIALVVDSSVQIIERLQQILSETDKINTVYGAVSFKDATRFFKANKTDVVLLDGGVPGNMPVDLLDEIKQTDVNTTVIILANSADYYMKVKFKLHGADFFFDKYHEFENIPGILDTIISKKNLKPLQEKPKHYSEFA
jgi:DNA-binding NtrC family response regulator